MMRFGFLDLLSASFLRVFMQALYISFHVFKIVAVYFKYLILNFGIFFNTSVIYIHTSITSVGLT